MFFHYFRHFGFSQDIKKIVYKMTDFQASIKDRFSNLFQTKELTEKKKQFNRKYFMALVDSDGNELATINDFQTAFLDLLDEKHSVLFSTFQQPLEERFLEMYGQSEFEDERGYRPADELVLHKIQMPSEQSDDWQLMYEMNSDDTIFHIDFNGWTFKAIGVTH